MKTFYKYVAPVTLACISFALSSFFGNELILFCGIVISLIWLLVLGVKMKHLAVIIISIILLLCIAGWGVLMLFVEQAWSVG